MSRHQRRQGVAGGATRNSSDDVIRLRRMMAGAVGITCSGSPTRIFLTTVTSYPGRWWHHLPVVSVGGGAIVALGGPLRMGRPRPGRGTPAASQCSPVPMLMR
jgi:hypothetical protein